MAATAIFTKPELIMCLPCFKSSNGFYCSQNTSPTFLCTHLNLRKAFTFALYMPCIACHLPFFLSKFIFIGQKITPVPSPRHDWGHISVRIETNYSAFLLVILDFQSLLSVLAAITAVNSRLFLLLQCQQPVFTYN